jgi:signal transduction histidine kinase
MGAMMSGGARSPLAPLLFAPVGIGFAAFGRQRAALACGAAGACAIAIWTCAPPLFAPPSPRIDAALSALVLTATLALLFAGVRTLAQAHDRAIDVATHAGDALVDQAALRARALEALGQKIAHEVKNPLTAVRGLCELSLESARASNGDVKTAKRLEVALSEVLRAQSILESYLSFARPLFALARSDVDVADLARAVVQALEATALGRGVSLSTEADNAGTAHLDSERMREALFNLVLNALDATPRGGRVEVRARVEAERARFVVVDDGAGMPPDVLARVGTPFHTTKEQGTGLGVALARHTAEAHGGTLAFESTPGGGTRAVVDVSVRGEAHGEDRDR